MKKIVCRYIKILQRIFIKVLNSLYSIACLNNDGLYVKMGQGIATMDHLLPPPFYKWFSKLQDKAKASPPDEIKKVFKDELGISVEDAFL